MTAATIRIHAVVFIMKSFLQVVVSNLRALRGFIGFYERRNTFGWPSKKKTATGFSRFV
jgi:hypothetical protein